MEIIKFIQTFENPFLDKVFYIFTTIGGPTIGLVLAIFLYWFYNKELGNKFFYGILFSCSINNIIKGIYNEPRPIGTEGIKSYYVLDTATGSSFPSGHSQGTASTSMLLMTSFKKKWIYAFSIIMMIGVPLSRLYFGVHWPRDVIFGLVLGILSILLSNKLFDIYSETNNFYIILVPALIMLILSFIFPSNDLAKSIGPLIGFLCGLFLEKKYVNFKMSYKPSHVAFKFLIGCIGALIIYIFFSKLFVPSLTITFFKYFFIVFYATFVAPYIFVKVKIA